MKNRKPLTIAATALLTASLTLPVTAIAAGDYKDGEVDRTAGQVIDDMSIAAKLKAALVDDPTTDANNIDIEVDRDMVQLNGFVDSEAAIERAEEIAEQIKGVKDVQNNLKLADSDRRAGEYLDDVTLQAEVKAALTESDITKARNIDVEVNRGIVSLGGHLDSERQIETAERIVSDITGVRDVENNLELRESS